MQNKKLTVGSAVYDDFEGVFFTYQSLRLNNLDRLDELDFLIIDNNPNSEEGKATKEYCQKAGIRYVAFTARRSTAVRNEIFWQAQAPYAMSMDSHVLLEPNAISQLLDFYDQNPNTKNLYQGPMVYDCLKHDPCTHMDPVWRDNMFGTWKSDKRGSSSEKEPFEIPLHGLGLFTCKVDAWPGFHILFKGFGGEEGYIHDKFKQNKAKTMCLPWLRWNHRFQRPRGVSYPLKIEERISNYYLGHLELSKDTDEIKKHFNKTHPAVDCDKIKDEMTKLLALYDVDADMALKVRFGEHIDGEEPEVEIETWENSNIKFEYPAKIKYVKFISLRSLDLYSCLGAINIKSQNSNKKHKILSVNSEDPKHPAKNLLDKKSTTFWLTDANNGVSHPHEVVIDLSEITDVESINIQKRQDGRNIGTIMEFKVLISQDGERWNRVSLVKY